ncbi:MAG: hypothetical protein PHE53_00075 [Thermoguttaceae bacterium]|nr:hypothetical protein [Thermoguttaceae bacterium]
MTAPTVSNSTLQALHRIHRRLYELRERLQMGPRVAAVFQKKILEATQLLEQQCETLQLLQLKASQKQESLKLREAELERRKRQLMEAKSNTEYKALQDQIAADGSASEVLELETLDAMERVDKQKLEIEGTVALIEKKKVDAQRHIDEYARIAPGLKVDIAKLEEEQRHEEAKLPSEFNAMYQRVLRSKGVDSFASLDGRSCSGCHTQITLQMYSEMVGGQFHFCRACGRILYLPDSFTQENFLHESKK